MGLNVWYPWMLRKRSWRLNCRWHVKSCRQFWMSKLLGITIWIQLNLFLLSSLRIFLNAWNRKPLNVWSVQITRPNWKIGEHLVEFRLGNAQVDFDAVPSTLILRDFKKTSEEIEYTFIRWQFSRPKVAVKIGNNRNNGTEKNPCNHWWLLFSTELLFSLFGASNHAVFVLFHMMLNVREESVSTQRV